MRRLSIIVIGAATIAAIAACSRVPKGIIEPEEMAQLMADIRVATAVVNVRSSEYRSEESREALMQAVFERHGVTEAEFDSSMIWYGHNIKLYQETTDRSVEILEHRLAQVGRAAAGAVSVAGDSVEVWNGAVAYIINNTSPSDYVTFSLPADANFERGDVYTWRVRFVAPPVNADWTITAEYDDGAVEVLRSMMSVSNPSCQRLSFYTDSTRNVRNISGWLKVERSGNRPVIMDSVSLNRRRIDPSMNGRRIQRLILPPNANDSTITG